MPVVGRPQAHGKRAIPTTARVDTIKNEYLNVIRDKNVKEEIREKFAKQLGELFNR